MSSYEQVLNPNDPIRFLQITDTHLFARKEDKLLGINTADSFQAVIDAILKEHFNYDLILATGDLVQDYNEQAYHRFAKMVKPLKKKVFWLQGNHDQPQMGDILTQYDQFSALKHILIGNKWQILLLDSQVFGVPHGRLGTYQLNWLAKKLNQNSNRYTLIALHHNILPTHSAWLDQHSLRNVHNLADVLKPYKNIKAIIHGHIHQEMDEIWNGCRILSTPSTCIQFKPHSNNFALDLLPQGWREFSLFSNGEIKTQVKRLKTNQFVPDFNANGY